MGSRTAWHDVHCCVVINHILVTDLLLACDMFLLEMFCAVWFVLCLHKSLPGSGRCVASAAMCYMNIHMCGLHVNGHCMLFLCLHSFTGLYLCMHSAYLGVALSAEATSYATVFADRPK